MANGNMQGMGMMAPGAMPTQNTSPRINIEPQQLKQAADNLSPETKEILEQHLTPGLKIALSELLGTDVSNTLAEIGPEEPTVNIPVSIIAGAYPAENIETSIQMMGKDFASKRKNNIPASPQGEMGGGPMMDSPQTNVPPMPMA
jgi:hypothetical protein|tara:strand:+ start:1879 stop:2313 length:435 start_codon:yes stop_codon:yes gene_type:complete